VYNNPAKTANNSIAGYCTIVYTTATAIRGIARVISIALSLMFIVGPPIMKTTFVFVALWCSID
jgi:hypothetical protein